MNIIDRYKKLGLWQKIGAWGSIASILAIVIWAISPVYNMLQKKSNKQLSPSIEIVEITPYLQNAYVNGEDLFQKRIFDKKIIEDDLMAKFYSLKFECSFVSTRIKFRNPNDRKITLQNLKFGILLTKQKYIDSNRYCMGKAVDYKDDKIKSGILLFNNFNQSIEIERNSIKNVDVHFIFNQLSLDRSLNEKFLKCNMIGIVGETIDGKEISDIKVYLNNELLSKKQIVDYLIYLVNDSTEKEKKINELKDELANVGITLKTKKNIFGEQEYILSFDEIDFNYSKNLTFEKTANEKLNEEKVVSAEKEINRIQEK